MQLTTFTDYALRVLMAAGAKGDHEASTVPEVARQFGISRNHVIKVVHHLSRSGYVSTSRGKGGGFRLAKPAAEIRIGDVIRHTETRFDVVPCLRDGPSPECVIEPACTLKRALREAGDAFLAVADAYTLADLVRPRQRLRQLLTMRA